MSKIESSTSAAQQPETQTTSLAPAPKTLPFKHALLVNGNGATWNLRADVVGYPFVVPGGDKKYKIGVYLGRYDARELKEALAQDALSYTPDMDGELSASAAKTYREYFPILERRFVAMDGITGDANEQRDFFLHNSSLKTLVVREGWGGVRIWRETEEVSDTPFDLHSVDDAPIPIMTVQKLHSPDGDYTVKMTHHLKHPTQNQYSRYMSAIKQKIGRRGAFTSEVNNDILELLYNEGAVKIDGMTLDEQPCTLDNRSDWIPLVPLWHKTLIVTELYRETRLKN